MKKHYFELDKVDSITLNSERETRFRWFPEIPARPKTFLGIKYGMHESVPAGWNDDIDVNGMEILYRKWNRKPTTYFADYSWYRVCDNTKRIYNKAHVEIRFGYKQAFGINFESNEEAQEYVNELIESSDKQFHVIIDQ